MYALRQSYDHAPVSIPVPRELQSQPMELIFLSTNDAATATTATPTDADRKERLRAAMNSARGCLDTGLTLDQIDAEVRAMRNEWL